MRRGSITLPIVLIMISFLTFAVIIVNYSRVNSANLKISILSESLADSILSKYDEYLYREYAIMGVHPEAYSEEMLTQMAHRSLIPESSNFDFYGFGNITVHAKKKSDFSNIQSFKVSILNANRSIFLVEQLEKAAKLFRFWKTFMEGKSLSELYTKAIELMGELQKKYDACKKLYKDLENRFDLLREKAGSVSSTELILLGYRLYEINNAKQKNPSEEEDTSAEKAEIQALIYNVTGMNNTIRKLSKEATNLRQELEEKLPRLSDIRKKLQEKKRDLTDEQFKESADRMMEDIMSFERSLQKAKPGLEELIANAAQVQKKFDRLESDLSKARSGKEVEHSEFDFKEEIDRLRFEIDVFEGKSEEIPNVMKVVKFFWKVIKGGLFTNYLRFDSDISGDVYQTLPAVKFWKNKSTRKDHPVLEQSDAFEELSGSEMSDESFRAFSRSMELDDGEYKKLSTSNMAEDLVDKFTVMDFALRYFDYNIYEKEGKSIRSLSKNPLCQSEIEYLIHGNQKPKLNMLFVDFQIWGMRNIANSITLLIYKKAEIKSLALSLSSVTFGAGYPVAFGLTLFGWSSLESLADVRILHEGHRLPVFKTKRDLLIDINADNLDSLIQSIEEKGIEGAYTWSEKERNASESSNEKGKTGILFDYRDYLFILMTFTEEQLLLHRIQDVIQIRGRLEEKEFDITSFATMYEVIVEADLPLIYSDLIKSKISSKKVLGY